MALAGSLYAGIDASPAHYGRALVDGAFEYLVPSDDAPSLAVDIFLYAVGEIALKGVGGQRQLMCLGLAFGTFGPAVARSLVATYVDVVGRKYVHYLVKDILAEAVHLLVAKAEHIGKDTPGRSHLIGTSRTSQIGICLQGSEHVPRHVYFGNDGDVAVGSIAYNLACLFLCIETAVRSAIVEREVVANDGLRPP